MTLFSFDRLKARSAREKEHQAIIELLLQLNSSIANIVGFAKTVHNPETGLEQSVKDALFLLDSTQEFRDSEYLTTSNSFYGRNVTGRLQRLEALEEEMNAIFKTLEETANE